MAIKKTTVAEVHRYTHDAAEHVKSPKAYEYETVVRIDGRIYTITGASVDKAHERLILDAK